MQFSDRDILAEMQRPRRWPWLLAAVVFVVLSPIAAFAARETTGKWMITWVAVQFVATGLAWLIPQIRQIRAEDREVSAKEREFAARVESYLAMNDALDPILALLGQIALEPRKVERDRLRAKAAPLVLTTAAHLIGPERSRAVFFELLEGPTRRLVPNGHAGRQGSSSSVFVEGTPSGDAAIGMVLEDEERICENIDEDPPPGWDATKKRDYKTFISVPVTAGDVAFGMLTMDALEPGDLTREDMRVLRLMASALAVALSDRT